MDEPSEASQERDALIADTLREESHNAPKQSPGNDDKPRRLGLLAGQGSVCFGDDFAMTEEELVDLSPVSQQQRQGSKNQTAIKGDEVELIECQNSTDAQKKFLRES